MIVERMLQVDQIVVCHGASIAGLISPIQDRFLLPVDCGFPLSNPKPRLAGIALKM